MRLLTSDEGWRIKRLIREAGLNQTRVAFRMDMGRAYFNLALQGRYGVDDDFVEKCEAQINRGATD